MMIVPRYTYIIVKSKSVHNKSELILKRTMNYQAKNRFKNKKFGTSTSVSRQSYQKVRLQKFSMF